MKTLCATLLVFAAILTSATAAEEPIQKRMHAYANEAHWTKPVERTPVDRAALVRSIELSRSFYLNAQRPAGNFLYSVDLRTEKTSKKDNQVRQAGALWGLSCLNRDRFNEQTRQALIKGLDFFASSVQTLPSGKKCLLYPGESQIATGTVALYCLALTEFLRGQERFLPEEFRKKYRELLDIHLDYLKSMELPDGSWACLYDVTGDIREPAGSPYYDGEALLAYCKAARYLGKTELIPRINDALPKLIAKYTADIWEDPAVSDDESRGFYQWCCMSLNEYIEAQWPVHRELAVETSSAYTYWLVHRMHIAHRMGNTAYALEGLLASWNIAGLTGNQKLQKQIQPLCFDIMSRLMLLQYNGPFMKENPTLLELDNGRPRKEHLVGGITSGSFDTTVRIDIQQHQTHAMLLMLEYFFHKM